MGNFQGRVGMRATVSGSFHRHMFGIGEAVGELRQRGVEVLSPSDPTVVDFIGEFLFVASDRLRSIKLVQDRHFEAIRHSDFLWVVCPDGYTGPSTAMEIGAAYLAGVPVYSDAPALDITVGEYVQKVSGYAEAIARAQAELRPLPAQMHVLLDPTGAIEGTIGTLEALIPPLQGREGDKGRDAERALDLVRNKLLNVFGGPPRNA